MLKLVALLALLAGVSCENYTTYNCDKKECVQALIGKPAKTSWSIQLEDAIVGWHKSIEIFMVSNVISNVGIAYTSSKDVIMLLNSDTNAAIVVTKRKAYLIDQCKTKMSFKDVTASKDTFLDVYKDDVVPKIGNFSNGFLLRPLFIHLYGNKDVKGAPGLNQELQDSLDRSFKDVFVKLHQAYKSKTAFVYQYEAGIMGLLLGDAERQNKLRLVLTPLFVYRQFSQSALSFQIFSRSTMYIRTFHEYAPVYWFSQSLFINYAEGIISYFFIANETTVKDTKGDEYYISFGTETKKKLYEIKLRKLDGTVDLSILTYPEINTWFIMCRITDLVLVMPATGRNYGLFRASTGASIIVDKMTQTAEPSTNNAAKIVQYHTDYFEKSSNIEMLRALNAVKVNQNGTQAFNFKSFIHKAHGATGLATLKASDKAKEELRKNFGDFIKDFRSIQGYDCHYQSSNVALYFFRNVSLAGMKEDYRSMVDVIGVRFSYFHRTEIVYATNVCTFNKYLA